MKNISVDKLTSGMKVAKTIYNNEGNILISAGMKLKKAYIKRLKELDIQNIYITRKNLPDVDVPDVISDQTRIEAVKSVNETLGQIKEGRGVNYQQITETVGNIIDELLVTEDKIVHFNNIRTFDSYIFHHSVNVTVLSLLIAMEIGYNEMKLKEIATGALLHDIGMILIEKKVIENKENFTQKEHQKFKKHPEYGYNILKENDKLSIKARHIAYQHHEKLDGSGYPRNLMGDEIIDYAQIVAVANIYDALTSDGSTYQRLEPHKALKVINSISGYKLKTKYVEALKKHIAKYPLGTLLVLNTGEIALVVEVNKDDLSAPIVKIVKDSSGKRIKENKKVNLAQSRNIKVKEIKS